MPPIMAYSAFGIQHSGSIRQDALLQEERYAGEREEGAKSGAQRDRLAKDEAAHGKQEERVRLMSVEATPMEVRVDGYERQPHASDGAAN